MLSSKARRSLGVPAAAAARLHLPALRLTTAVLTTCTQGQHTWRRKLPQRSSNIVTSAAMTTTVEGWMQEVLQRREEEGTLRELKVAEAEGCSVDFGSNDYLGLARLPQLAKDTEAEVEALRAANSALPLQQQQQPAATAAGVAGTEAAAPSSTSPSSSPSPALPPALLSEYGMLPPLMGSGGSRLLSGNSQYAEDLEGWLANFHKREAALIFNSGYDANLGVLSCIPQPGDAVVYDELVHNSMQMGMRLGRQTTRQPFRHNDAQHLDQVLGELRREARATQRIYVAVESVYSMDGDCAPLAQLLQVAQAHGASVIVDEAHATGVLGPNGEGLVGELGLESSPALLCCVHTFGKALGVHGAAVLGSATLRTFLINYARPLIYSTSLPLHSLAAIRCAYALQRGMHQTRVRVRSLIGAFRSQLIAGDTGYGTPPLRPSDLVDSASPIQAVLVPGNERVIKVSSLLRQHGFDVRPIRKPTVPEGTERLRICIHAHNTPQQVRDLVQHIRAFMAGAEKCGLCTCGKTCGGSGGGSSAPCKCHHRLEHFIFLQQQSQSVAVQGATARARL